MNQIHGKTIIELTDVHTGEKETFVDHNMVTNALNEFFNGMYGAISNVYQGRDYPTINFFVPLFKRLLGGVLLFEDSITENVNQLYAPPGANCIGYASTEAYGGQNTFRGSWNSVESGALSDGTGYKFVWDFSTSQANGVISCAALTTPFGGRFGYGMAPTMTQNEFSSPSCYKDLGPNSDATSAWFNVGPFLNLCTGSRIGFYKTFDVDCYLRSANISVGWEISTVNGSDFKIIKNNIDLNHVGILNGPNDTKIISETTITTSIFANNADNIAGGASRLLASPFSYLQCDFDYTGANNSNGYAYIYAIPFYDTAQTTIYGQKLYIVKINLDTVSIVWEKSIDLTGCVAYKMSSGDPTWNRAARYGVVSAENFYCYHHNGTFNGITGTNKQIIKIDLNTPTNIKKIDLIVPTSTTNLPYVYYNYPNLMSIGKIKGRILTPCNIIDSNDRVLLYPIVQVGNTDYTIDKNVSYCQNALSSENRDSNMFLSKYEGGSGGQHSISFVRNLTFYTPCLFTINNLDTPVTKTADKTMKVTYILTEGA